MNNVSPEKKKSVPKTVAVVGFIAIIIIIAWLSIQLVSVLPSAFSSLASLAEGVNQYQQSSVESEELADLQVTSNTTLVNSGGAVDISWNTAKANGSYVFAYECTDGVAVDIITTAGTQSIECNSNYNVGAVDTVALAIESVKNRYADVAYSISFIETDGTEPRAAGDATFTVVNSSISNLAVEETPSTEAPSPEAAPEAPTPETPSTPDTTTPTPAPTPTKPVYEQEYVYTIPTSNPNGFTDLATKFLYTGTITNNRFTPAVIDQDETGAIQFEVKNIGTRTSEDWTFTIALPGGTTYTSKTQKALKPNERAVLTIGFQAAGVTTHTFDVEVDTARDRSASNNDFDIFVRFAR